ncbi:other/FunK1 protein kinase [Coprinopsis cinerea okayama7|uniref:Other/FunK1 protein kinase n=1 Tax=Coprinopsis cinerea (strain Okayama-7 / 130 / ATCC MYA-4618 / FGSC 9003) TaxID=240176 RepID=A8NAU2_COPC7|nr:other/FunK1 protein kinase [Coprinopsis cinerea okayama7\|eukprot:XP_001831944.2 other/FunK1 protein kinase [Coprinopsis cinerea okayama7\
MFPFNTPQHSPQKPDPKTASNATPRPSRHIAAAKANTTGIRYDIAEAMNSETFVCDVEAFMAHYLPKVEDRVLSQVLGDLIEKEVLIPRKETKARLQPSGKGKSAKAVSPSIPSMSYSHVLKNFKPPCGGGKKDAREENIFSPLTEICTAICEALNSIDGVKLNGYTIRMCGHNGLVSLIKGGDQRIDACMTKNTKGRLRVTDIVVVFEFKTNRVQIVSHSNHAMNEDPRRMFTLGITIEDGGFSLWYFSRSHSAKSWAFNMVERAHLFIKIMIALFCATDEELGFNPLVELLDDDISFVYKFPSSGDNEDATFFRTQATIFQTRSPTLTGRSTRILRVQQVDPSNGYAQIEGTKDMILKDVSLHVDVRTEDDIQKRLFADVEKFRSNPERPWRDQPIVKDFGDKEKTSLAEILEDDRFMDFFSCIIKAYTGQPSLPVVPNASVDPNLFPTSLKNDEETYVHQFETNRPDPGCERTKEDEITKPKNPPSPDLFPLKKQCLYIFPEVYTPLYNIPTMGQAIQILKQCVLVGCRPLNGNYPRPFGLQPYSLSLFERHLRAHMLKSRSKPWHPKSISQQNPRPKGLGTLSVLQLMACAGWVHRDISAGNILAMWNETTRKWQLKLSDLEYAKKFPSEKGSKSSAVPKTGSPFFMAVAVQSQSQIRPPPDLAYHTIDRAFDNQATIRSYFIALEDLRSALYDAYCQRNKQEDISSYSTVISKPFRAFFETLDKSPDLWQSVELIMEKEKKAVGPPANKRKANGDVKGRNNGKKVPWVPNPKGTTATKDEIDDQGHKYAESRRWD